MSECRWTVWTQLTQTHHVNHPDSCGHWDQVQQQPGSTDLSEMPEHEHCKRKLQSDASLEVHSCIILE